MTIGEDPPDRDDGPVAGASDFHRRTGVTLDNQTLPLGEALNLGLGFFQHGRYDRAAAVCHAILRAFPGHPTALNILGGSFLEAGEGAKAVECFEAAIAHAPDDANAHTNLGLALARSGRFEDAVASYRRSLELDKNNATVHVNLGIVLVELGELAQALACFQAAARLQETDDETHYHVGTTLQLMGQSERAIASFRTAIRLNPHAVAARVNLGNEYKKLRKLPEAIACFREALALDPNCFEAHLNLGNAFDDLGDQEEALASYQNAARRDPEFPDTYYNIASLYHDQGNLAEAERHYRKALSLKPDYGEAFRGLAETVKLPRDEPSVVLAERIYSAQDTPRKQRMEFGYGLGYVYDKHGECDRAFSCFAAANQLNWPDRPFSIQDFRRFVSRTIAVFDHALMERYPDAGSPDETPIFILGMPRSGTSLVEQILSSHPEVFGGGELEALRDVRMASGGGPDGETYPELMRSIEPHRLKGLGTSYIDTIRKLSPTSPFITDKMPRNFENVGFINLILPKAKVIHVSRDPLDTCLSIFKAGFAGEHGYARDLRTLGQYYKQYQRLMGHWRDTLPGFMLEISYEDLIQDPQAKTASMLEFCGLDWDDRCLEFYNNRRAVKTASRSQVRKPIYRDSVNAWKRYEAHLQPLAKTLGRRA